MESRSSDETKQLNPYLGSEMIAGFADYVYQSVKSAQSVDVHFCLALRRTHTSLPGNLRFPATYIHRDIDDFGFGDAHAFAGTAVPLGFDNHAHGDGSRANP